MSDPLREALDDHLPARVVVGQNGAYWRDFTDDPDHPGYSMCPVSTDNDPVEPIAVYVRLAAPPPEAGLREALDRVVPHTYHVADFDATCQRCRLDQRIAEEVRRAEPPPLRLREHAAIASPADPPTVEVEGKDGVIHRVWAFPDNPPSEPDGKSTANDAKVSRPADPDMEERLAEIVDDVRYAGGNDTTGYWRGFNDGIDRLAAHLIAQGWRRP